MCTPGCSLLWAWCPHPFFTVSDTNGYYRLPPGLGAGRYTLAAIHPKAGEMTQEIKILAGEQKDIPFLFTLPPKPQVKVASDR